MARQYKPPRPSSDVRPVPESAWNPLCPPSAVDKSPATWPFPYSGSSAGHKTNGMEFWLLASCLQRERNFRHVANNGLTSPTRRAARKDGPFSVCRVKTQLVKILDDGLDSRLDCQCRLGIT